MSSLPERGDMDSENYSAVIQNICHQITLDEINCIKTDNINMDI